MKRILFLTIVLLFVNNLKSQNVGVGTTTPSHKFHVLETTGTDPLRIQTLQGYVSENNFLVIDPTSGVVRYMPLQNLKDSVFSDTLFLDSIVLSKFDTLYTLISDSLLKDTLWINTLDSIMSSDTIYFNDTSYTLIRDSLLKDTLFLDSLISLIGDSIDTDIDSMIFINDTLYLYEDNQVLTAYINVGLDTALIDSLIINKSDTLYTIISDSLLKDTLWIHQLDSLLGIYGDTIYFNDTSYTLIKDSLLNDTLWLDSLISLIGDSINTDDQNIDSLTLTGTILTTYIEDGSSAFIDLQPIIDSAIANSTGADNDWDINANGTGLEAAPAGDNDASGLHAIAAGQADTASGNYSTVSGGRVNIASGQYAVISGGRFNVSSNDESVVSGGDYNTASGSSSVVSGGRSNTANGNYFATISGGYSNTSSGNYSVVSGGYSNTAFSYGEWVGGLFNTSYVPSSTTTWVGTDRLFVVGNGTSTVARSNALTLFKDGRLEINEAYTLPNVDGTLNQVLTTNGSGVVSWQSVAAGGTDDQNLDSLKLNGTRLEAFIESGDSASVDLQPIIDSAIANSTVVDNDWDINTNGTGLEGHPGTNISSGPYSITAGDGNVASGDYCIAFGQNDTANWYWSVVSGGRENRANDSYATISGGFRNKISGGSYSTVSGGRNNVTNGTYTTVSGGGYNTAASSFSSLSGGNFNSASGDYSVISGGRNNSTTGFYSTVSGGFYNLATGYNSAVSGGYYNTAFSFGEWVGGLYSTSYVPSSTTAWVGTDRLFVVGNGTSTVARSNALTLFKDGRLEINEAYTLPNVDGTLNQVLTTNGSGVVSWQPVATGTDDQNIDSLTLIGTVLTTYIENGTSSNVNLQPIIDSALAHQDSSEWEKGSLHGDADTVIYAVRAKTAGNNIRAYTNGDFDVDRHYMKDDTVFLTDEPNLSSLSARNLAIGKGALESVTSSAFNGLHNTAVGYMSMNRTTTGVRNTAVGYLSLSNNTTGGWNTAFGENSLLTNTTGVANTALGTNSMNLNTTGRNNTSIGDGAMFVNTTGSWNIAVGDDALRNQGNGSYNIGIGIWNLRLNSGSLNISIGDSSMYSNTSGSRNISLGRRNTFRNTTGSNNQSIGDLGLYNNLTGNSNIAFGDSTLFLSTTGSNNIAIGKNALAQSVEKSNNIAIGNNAFNGVLDGTPLTFTAANVNFITDNFTITGHGLNVGETYLLKFTTTGTAPSPLVNGNYYYFNVVDGNTLNCQVNVSTSGTGSHSLTPNIMGTAINAVAIGNNSQPTKSNQIALGDSNMVEVRTYGSLIPGRDGSQNIGSGTERWNTLFATNGTINTSDKRLKTNIKELEYGLETVLKMNSVSYNWKQNDNGVRLGFIAQELQSIVPEVVNIANDKDSTLGVRYNELIPVLTKAIQEQQEIINQLKKDNQELKRNEEATNSTLSDLTNKLEYLEQLIKKNQISEKQ